MAKEIVRIEGLRECKEALRQLPDATAKNVLRRILRRRAQPIAEHAQSLVPVDTGQLKSTITVSSKLTKSQRKNYTKEGKYDIEMFVGPTNLPSAHLQEFGSSIHGAQPYMRPAWEAEKDKLVDNLAKDLWDEIRKAAERLARKAARRAA